MEKVSDCTLDAPFDVFNRDFHLRFSDAKKEDRLAPAPRLNYPFGSTPALAHRSW